MSRLKNICPRLVSEEDVLLQCANLRRLAPMVNWEAAPKKTGRRPIPTDQIIRHFWERVNTTGDCWLWTGGCFQNGYGAVPLRGRLVKAHRLSYGLRHGKIPRGLCILHKCDTPPCVNPDHLFIGTHLDNARDRATKGRGRKGEDHFKAKLSEAQVLEIVRRYENEMAKTLAEEFRVSIQAIFSIVGGHNWAWLTKIAALEKTA